MSGGQAEPIPAHGHPVFPGQVELHREAAADRGQPAGRQVVVRDPVDRVVERRQQLDVPPVDEHGLGQRER
jgi:hypothetical protein